MKPGVAKGIHWRPKQSISQQVRTENITYLLTDRYVLGHVTGLNGFYLSRFKTPFLNLPVLYIPCKIQSEIDVKKVIIEIEEASGKIMEKQWDVSVSRLVTQDFP